MYIKMEWLLAILGIGWLLETFQEKVDDKRNKKSKTSNYNKPSNHHARSYPQPAYNSSIYTNRNKWTEEINGKGLTPGSYWYNIRQKILKRDRYTCVHCGSKVNLTVDHKVALSLGGDNSLDNLTTLCKDCHEHKDQKRIFEKDFDHDDNYGKNTQLSNKVAAIAEAVRCSNSINMAYRDRSGRETVRTITPHQIVKENNKVYVISYCHLRNQGRTFRLSRITLI